MSVKPISVAVVVSDRKKALKWYREKLGLRVLANEDHWVVVGSRDGVQLHLCEPMGGKLEKGNTGILFQTSGSVPAAYRALSRKGVKFPNPPKKVEWGWFCQFQDPDGNIFWLAPKG